MKKNQLFAFVLGFAIIPFANAKSASAVTIGELLLQYSLTREGCFSTGVGKIVFWDGQEACFRPTADYPAGLYRMSQDGVMSKFGAPVSVPVKPQDHQGVPGGDVPTGVSPLVSQLMGTEGLSETQCRVGVNSLFVSGKLAACFLPTRDYQQGIYFVTDDLKIVRRGSSAPVAPPTQPSFSGGGGAVPDGGASISNTSIFYTSNNSFALSADIFNSLSNEVRRDGLTLTNCGNSVIMKYGEFSACIMPTSRYSSGTWRMR